MKQNRKAKNVLLSNEISVYEMMALPMEWGDNFFIEGIGTNGYPIEKDKIRSIPPTKHQDNSKCIKNLNVKDKIKDILEKKKSLLNSQK